MKLNINLHNRSTKATVPKEVAEAFENYEQQFISEPKETLQYVLMGIPFSLARGQAEILKKYASTNPTKYLQAVLHGYVVELDAKQEVAKMIDEWLSNPYVTDKPKDIKQFASSIVDFLQKQT